MRASKKKGCINRVCGYCNQEFDIGDDNINDAIYYGSKTYHSKCFFAMKAKIHFSVLYKTKFTPEKKLPKEEVLINDYKIDVSKYKKGNRFISHGKEQLLNDFNKILNEKFDEDKKRLPLFIEEYSKSKGFQNIKLKSDKHLKCSIDKQHIDEFITDNYGIVCTGTIYKKLGNIYNGSFGMKIPPSDLLDMWKRKINMLNNISKQFELKGKTIQPEDKVIYDLSVLVNKYNSYLRWKEKQKILESEKDIEKSQNIVSQSIGYTNLEKDNSNDTDNISDLVDDIFG